MKNILILYNTPIGEERILYQKLISDMPGKLRKDILRSMSRSIIINPEIWEDVQVIRGFITRLSVATWQDLINALSAAEYEIIQFSGRDPELGFCLELENSTEKREISSEQVADLLSKTQPNLKAVVFLSCFSTDSIPDLIKIVPCIITVSGKESAEFIRQLYLQDMPSASIENHFFDAQKQVFFPRPDISMYLAKGRVLVVDDLPDVRQTISMIVEDAGYLVKRTCSREDALKVLHAKKDFFSVAILDIRMDETNEVDQSGISLMHDINIISPQTKIIMLTGFGSTDLITEALTPNETGVRPAFAFLLKHSGFDKLIECIEKAFPQKIFKF